MTISARRVQDIFRDCLIPSGGICVEGIHQQFAFHPEKLEQHRADVKTMLMLLPKEFMKSQGGGTSFLMGCKTRGTGRVWGEQEQVEQLLVLGMALGMVSYVLPRRLWALFPEGLPYYVIEVA